MVRYDYLKALYELGKIAQGENGIDKSKLEEDFLRFSVYSPGRILQVRSPNVYLLEGEERKNFSKVIRTIGIQSPDSIPEVAAIGISGDFEALSSQQVNDYIIVASLQQVNADHYSDRRSYLNPLLQVIFQEGAKLIQNFSIHEAVFGKVKAKRGHLVLADISLFPEQFSAGPYSLELELDTPTKTIEEFRNFHQILEQIISDPKRNILDPKMIEEVTERGLQLRRKIGSLSRYEIPTERVFKVETNSCLLEDHQNASYYLYHPELKKNVVVYFGVPPLPCERKPRALTLLQGDAQEHTLAELVKLNFLNPSLAVLKSRIEDLDQLYQQTYRSRQEEEKETRQLRQLIHQLQKVGKDLAGINNPAMRTDYALRLPHEMLEFLVYPSSEDPVIHHLLSRLSWNKSIRDYHHTEAFKLRFTEADQVQRSKLIREVKTNLIFRTQQNEEVNLWLYQYHQPFCQSQGIEFQVRGKKVECKNLNETEDQEEYEIDLTSL